VTDRPINLRLDEQLCFALHAALGSVTRSYRPLLAQIGLTVHPSSVRSADSCTGARSLG